ncbi:helix-turn-helix transcriptional regulator [Pseudomonas sp. 21LCFQ010]|uniref:ATP-binding protein n=1 Tax=unclassified Pseudomonas TaxID=196821 RepID=UPI0005F0193A|nr:MULTISPECIES: winged helix-turn-helix domain-containing protein [unclassified Pseudomonas]MCO8164382.1 helix-turn-helix transcriptional regulator [Pseudomonas sp. 21LCFQ010]
MNSLNNTSGDAVLLFGPYALHVRQRQVMRSGVALTLGGRALDILQVLVEQAGQVLSKQQIIEQVWPDSVVEEVNLRVHIAALRRALGGGRDGQRYIATVAQRGYSFVAQVSQGEDAGWSTGEVVAQHNLPAMLTPLIGRNEQVASLARQLSARRLITLTGPAGVGKSRLACRVAELLVGHYRDGVWLLDCSSAAPEQLLEQLVALLQLEAAGRPALDVLGEALAVRQCLLIFDSAECLPHVCRQWGEGLLAQAPQLTILATSRQPLYARGEYCLPVPALEVPSRAAMHDRQQVLACSAVQLWVSRVQACQPDYRLREQDLSAVTEICRQLDGLPLAIELLASQLDVFALSGLRAQMSNGQWLLSLGRRTAVARHQSLGAALDWSHAHLSEQEQTLLRRLAIFALDFTWQAASAVVCCEDFGPDQLRNVLVLLEAKSLLTVRVDHQTVRYRLLNTVRVHALRRLQACGEYPALQVCYERYMGYPQYSLASA